MSNLSYFSSRLLQQLKYKLSRIFYKIFNFWSAKKFSGTTCHILFSRFFILNVIYYSITVHISSYVFKLRRLQHSPLKYIST